VAVSSFVVSLLMLTVFFLDMAFAGYARATGTASPIVNGMLGLILFFSWFLGLIAIGMGIAGLRDKTSKRAFSITGIVISGAAIALSLSLMVLGVSQKS
jgi:hypothetical protein